MFVVKLIGKLLLIPVIVILFVLSLVVAVIGGIYGMIHSLFWGLMIMAITVSIAFSMWPQAIFFFICMMVSLVIIAMMEIITSVVGGAIGTVASFMTAK